MLGGEGAEIVAVGHDALEVEHGGAHLGSQLEPHRHALGANLVAGIGGAAGLLQLSGFGEHLVQAVRQDPRFRVGQQELDVAREVLQPLLLVGGRRGVGEATQRGGDLLLGGHHVGGRFEIAPVFEGLAVIAGEFVDFGVPVLGIAGEGGEQLAVVVGVVENLRQLPGAGAGGLGSSIGFVIVGGGELVIPTEARLIDRIQVDDAVAPVDAEQALAAVLLRQLHVALETVDMLLGEPHAGIVLQPRYRPTLAGSELAKDLVDRIPAEGVAKAGEDHVAGELLVKILEVARHPAPAGDDQTLFRCVAAQEVVGHQEGGGRKRDARLAAVPIHALVLPEPDMRDVGVGFEQLGQAGFEQFFGGDRFHVEAHTGLAFTEPHLGGQGAEDLVGDLIRLEADAGADAQARGVSIGVAEQLAGAFGGFPGITGKTRGVAAEDLGVVKIGAAHAEAGGALGQVSPAVGGGGVQECEMSNAAELEGEVGFGPLFLARVDVHAEGVEAHAQHGFEVGAEILLVIDGDAVEEVRPGEQAADGEAGGGGPGAVLGREEEGGGDVDGVSVAIDSEDCALPLEKIEDGVEQGLLASGGECHAAACSGDNVGLRMVEFFRFHAKGELHLSRAGIPEIGSHAELAQSTEQFALSEFAFE